MDLDLDRLQQFVNEMNRNNSILDKIETLRKYPDLKEAFIYIYDTVNISYGITSKNIKKMNDLKPFSMDKVSVFSVLDKLKSREITGHNAIRLVKTLINQYPQHEGLIYNIIDRNLKTRTEVNLINKVWLDLIPTFNIALAETYDANTKLNFEEDFYFASRKCDGVRLIVKIQKDNIKFYSRQGKLFTTLDILKKEILEKLPTLDNIVLDGELCLVDENGNEDFQSVMEQIRRKDHTIPNPMFMIFDILYLDAFEEKYSDIPFIKRLELLNKTIPKDCKYMKILDQVPVRDYETLREMNDKAKKLNWEGLVLRKAHSPYEGKRTKNLIKVKTFIDAEYIVKDVEMGPIRHIVDKKEIESIMLSKVIIEHKGNDVGVGSGFSMEQRLYFKDHPEDIIGKVITVTYFEETKNQDGTFSLRFPVVKYIHGDKRST